MALRHEGWPNRIQVSVEEVKSNFISRPTQLPNSQQHFLSNSHSPPQKQQQQQQQFKILRLHARSVSSTPSQWPPFTVSHSHQFSLWSKQLLLHLYPTTPLNMPFCKRNRAASLSVFHHYSGRPIVQPIIPTVLPVFSEPHHLSHTFSSCVHPVSENDDRWY